MTVSSLTVKNSYNGDNTTTAFSYTFPIHTAAELQVIERSALGTETVKTLNSDYTITDNGAAGGSVNFSTAPANGVTIVLLRNTSLTQEVDYVSNDPFPAETHEGALDKLTLQVQEVQEEVDRSLKLSRTNTMNSTEFTVNSSDRSGKILGFDTNGELVVSQELGSFKGNWSTSTTYAARDIVKDTSTNNIFLANTGHTSSGSEPLTTNTDSGKWDLLVDAASATTAQNAAAASATAAQTSETNAATSATSAATSFDNFDDRFLGTKASNPAVDNDGNTLAEGSMYYNSTDNDIRFWNGSAWHAPETNSAASATAASASETAAATSAAAALVSENNSSTSASSASSSASSATSSAAAALASKNAASASETASAASETAAASSQSASATSASAAASSASSAASSATSAQAAQTAAETAYDNFDDRYLGPKSSDPSVDNDNNTLLVGSLYFNTSSNVLKYWTGSSWNNVEAVDTSNFASNGFAIAMAIAL